MSTITPLPTPPSRSRPTQFSAETDAFLSALATFGTEVNVVAGEINDDATTASNAAVTSTSQAGAATASASAAEGFAMTASAAADVTKWVTATSYSEGVVVWSPLNFQSYRCKSAVLGTTDPSLDTINWEPLSTNGGIVRVERTTNTQLTRANHRNLIDITSGTFSQTFVACATLGNGWWCLIRNSGTGFVTLDPSGSETIDGLSTFVMYHGEVRLIQCDGSALRSVVISGFYKTFTSSATFVKPPGYQRFAGILFGAGAGGGRAASTPYGGCGGAGCPFDLPASAFGTTETIVIGDGGESRTTDGTPNPGGNSSMGSLVWAGGGGVRNIDEGGEAYIQTNNYTGVLRGTTGSTFYAGTGRPGLVATQLYSVYGSGAGATIYGTSPGLPGKSVFGVDGSAASSASNGTDGVAPGGGGGATNTGTRSGAGARGELRIWGIV